LLQSGFVPRCDLLTRQTQDPCIAKPGPGPGPGASGRQHLLWRFRDAGQNVLQERIREGDLRVYQGEEGLHLLPHIYEGSCDLIFQVFYRLGFIATPKRTTTNVYGKAMDASKRQAHGKVVRLMLAPKVA
jgi:hypothetical protein